MNFSLNPSLLHRQRFAKRTSLDDEDDMDFTDKAEESLAGEGSENQ